MSAPLTYGIAANAKHADCAAFFFNWVATNDAARQINVATDGARTLAVRRMPRYLPFAAGSVTTETLAAGPVVGKAATRWTSSPTRPARSSPRAGRPSSRRWSAASKTLPGCSKPSRPSTCANWLSSNGEGHVTMPAPSKSTVTSTMTSDNRPVAPTLSPGGSPSAGRSAGRPLLAGCSFCPRC